MGLPCMPCMRHALPCCSAAGIPKPPLRSILLHCAANAFRTAESSCSHAHTECAQSAYAKQHLGRCQLKCTCSAPSSCAASSYTSAASDAMKNATSRSGRPRCRCSALAADAKAFSDGGGAQLKPPSPCPFHFLQQARSISQLMHSATEASMSSGACLQEHAITL